MLSYKSIENRANTRSMVLGRQTGEYKKVEYTAAGGATRLPDLGSKQDLKAYSAEENDDLMSRISSAAMLGGGWLR